MTGTVTPFVILAFVLTGLLSRAQDLPNPHALISSDAPPAASSTKHGSAQSGSKHGLEPIRNHLASHLVGLAVENRDGERLGNVKDFIVDLRTGSVVYALLSSGGILGVNPHLKIVPAPALSTATAKKGVAVLGVSKERWRNAPPFHRSEISSMNDTNRLRQIYGFYGQAISNSDGAPASTSPERHRKGKVQAASGGDGVAIAERPNQSPSFLANGTLRLSSELRGTVVVDEREEACGRVEDLLIDLAEARPALVIFSNSGFIKSDEHFAVPLRSLAWDDRHRFVLQTRPGIFDRALVLRDVDWAATSNRPGADVWRFDPRQPSLSPRVHPDAAAVQPERKPASQ
jgi:sporulation protein YlmC with PRC-barrel domain